MRLFKGNKKKQRLSLQLNKSAAGAEVWHVAGALDFTESITGSIRRHDTIPWWRKKGTWTRSRSLSCVSMVYNNTAQAALYIVGPFGKNKWSPIPDQTDPPGGNHICSILSEGGVKRKLQKKKKITKKVHETQKTGGFGKNSCQTYQDVFFLGFVLKFCTVIFSSWWMSEFYS